MVPAKRNLIIIISAILLAASSLAPIFMGSLTKAYFLDMFVPKEDAEYAKQYIERIREGDFATVEKETNSKIFNSDSSKTFYQLSELFPNEVPESIDIINERTEYNNELKKFFLLFEYEFSNKWLVVDIVIQKQGNNISVEGIHIKPLEDSIENLTRFTFSGKRPIHYIIFTLALGLLIFNIYVLALCIKTPIPRRKWLWIIFILTGFGAVSFNWVNGELFFTPLMVKIPLVQFSHELCQPFFITMLIPVGAIIFLFKRKKWMAERPNRIAAFTSHGS